MRVWKPNLTAVIVTGQEAVPGLLLCTKVQVLLLNVSVATEELTATVPAGVNVIPGVAVSVSVTVTITEVGAPCSHVLGDRLTAVVVVRVLTVKGVEVGPLAECTAGLMLGEKRAVMVCPLAVAAVTVTMQEAVPTEFP